MPFLPGQDRPELLHNRRAEVSYRAEIAGSQPGVVPCVFVVHARGFSPRPMLVAQWMGRIQFVATSQHNVAVAVMGENGFFRRSARLPADGKDIDRWLRSCRCGGTGRPKQSSEAEDSRAS